MENCNRHNTKKTATTQFRLLLSFSFSYLQFYIFRQMSYLAFTTNSRISSSTVSSSSCMVSVRGFDRSIVQTPMIDFPSTIYLPFASQTLLYDHSEYDTASLLFPVHRSILLPVSKQNPPVLFLYRYSIPQFSTGYSLFGKQCPDFIKHFPKYIQCLLDCFGVSRLTPAILSSSTGEAEQPPDKTSYNVLRRCSLF